MKISLTALRTVILSTLVLSACTAPPPKTTTRPTTPQTQVKPPLPTATIPPRKRVIAAAPQRYQYWLMQDSNLAESRAYERFLERNQVANIIPSHELFKTARDWQKCGRAEYMVPNQELWNNQLETLKVFKYLVASGILTDFEVTSVYRDLPLNQCAGGASASRHLFNSAIDFRIGPQYPNADDYAYIESTKYKLCQFWAQHGQRFNLGLGMYASGQIHIDTQGYRTWGPSLGSGSSMCHF